MTPDHADPRADGGRVLRMLVVHDLVETDGSAPRTTSRTGTARLRAAFDTSLCGGPMVALPTGDPLA
jgi:hypothetical protein